MKKIKDENKEIWEHYQTNQREVFNNSHARFHFLTKIIKKQKETGKILDIGLGEGYFLEILAKNNYQCYGIDIPEKSIKKNQQRFNKQRLPIKLKQGNINKIPFENDSFDFITASEVLEHLNNRDLTLGIKEINRCLKKNGVFIGTVPANENLKDNFCFCPNCGKSFHRWGHQQSFDKEKIEKLFFPYFKNLKIIKRPVIIKSSFMETLISQTKWIISYLQPNLFSSNFIIIAKKFK